MHLKKENWLETDGTRENDGAVTFVAQDVKRAGTEKYVV